MRDSKNSESFIDKFASKMKALAVTLLMAFGCAPCSATVLRLSDHNSPAITPAPGGSFTVTDTSVVASIYGLLGEGFQTLILTQNMEGQFVSIWELSNVPIVHSSPPRQLGDFYFPGGTSYTYRDEIELTDSLAAAFTEPSSLRFEVTLADGTEVFRSLEVATIPEPSVAVLGALLTIQLLSRRRLQSNANKAW